MMCEECGIRPASIHITTIVGDTHKEVSLCPVCMMRHRNVLQGMDLDGIAGLLRGIVTGHTQPRQEQDEEPVPDLTCDVCGTTYEEFRKNGMLGCAGCYKAFREPLELLLQRIHGNTQHAGRMPGSVRAGVTIRMQIERMQQMLKKAIETEEYEQAAKLRDSIRALQAQLNEQEKDIRMDPPRRINQGGDQHA